MAVKNNKLSVLLAVLLVIVGAGAFWVVSELKQANNELATTKKELHTVNEQIKKTPATPEEILAEVNKLRTKVGVAPLRLDPRLNASAMMKAQDMYENNYYDHVNPTTGKQGYSYIQDIFREETYGQGAGENLLSCDTTLGVKAEDIIRCWIKSEPHYKAIVNPQYKSMGFAYHKREKIDGVYKNSYIAVQHFFSK